MSQPSLHCHDITIPGNSWTIPLLSWNNYTRECSVMLHCNEINENYLSLLIYFSQFGILYKVSQSYVSHAIFNHGKLTITEGADQIVCICNFFDEPHGILKFPIKSLIKIWMADILYFAQIHFYLETNLHI